MLRWSQHPDENRKYYFWPWEEEDISAAEYQRSLQGLKHFLEEVEVSQLQTLEDLSAAASLIGHDLQTLAAARGVKIEKKIEQFEPGASEAISSVEREYIFSKFVADHEVVVTARNGHTFVSVYRMVAFQLYRHEELRVMLPADRDIAIGEKPNVHEDSIYALDLRGERVKEYHPVDEPCNSEIQQEFTRVLKDGVRGVLSVLS